MMPSSIPSQIPGVSIGAPKRAIVVGSLAAALLGIPLLLAYTSLPGIPCLFKMAFHIPCPGCGLTRSMTSLWHGNLLLSFRYHPLGIPLFIAGVFTLFYSLLRPGRITTETLAGPRARRFFGTFAIVMVSLWVVRLALSYSGNGFFLW